MHKKNKGKSIEEILSSKKIRRTLFTVAEQRIIVSEQKKIIDELMKREVDGLATQILKPWLDLSNVLQKAEPDSPLAKAVKEMRQPSR